MEAISPFELGATLYVPATHPDLLTIAMGQKIQGLRSMVICLEDAVAEADIPAAIDALAVVNNAMSERQPGENYPIVFVRPRHLAMAEYLVNTFSMAGFYGLVLPKFTRSRLHDWLNATRHSHLKWMPTLEDASVFDSEEMRALAVELQTHAADRILALRIGGNDLLSTLGLRRVRGMTLYEGPLGYVVRMLVTTFMPRGFKLTSPVYEVLDDFDTLQRELAQDIAHGLVGKTAIHPSQLAVIHDAWKPGHDDYVCAMQLLNTSAAVYQADGAMVEPATHRNWAETIVKRAHTLGVKPAALEREKWA